MALLAMDINALGQSLKGRLEIVVDKPLILFDFFTMPLIILELGQDILYKVFAKVPPVWNGTTCGLKARLQPELLSHI